MILKFSLGVLVVNKINLVVDALIKEPKTWLITGVAGFIGSNLLEFLLKANQRVVGLDNLSTGHYTNLSEVRSLVTSEQWGEFTFYEGDIRNLVDCQVACKNVDYVLHQAALGSVPRSINDPIRTNEVNITGFLNMLVAASESDVKSFTYAASSSTYGDHPGLPKVEELIGKPLSPYAVTKYVNEVYAEVFSRVYGFKSIGLRYFNVFGKRQDPQGAYAAVIPRWISAMINMQPIKINGDGETSRDFCFIDNVIQANILAATAGDDSKNNVYNVAVGDRTTLNDLAAYLKDGLSKHGIQYSGEITHGDFRKGDVRHSLADVNKAKRLLGYEPMWNVKAGLESTIDWFVEKNKG